MMGVMRAAIYLRVSTDEQADSGLGLEAQRAKCEAAIEARGWSVAGEFVDAGVSGKVPPTERPQLVAALEMLCVPAGKGRRARRRADVLVVAKLDRASRSAFDLLWLRREADRCGFELLVLDPELDTTTPAGRFQFTVMAGVAELERELIAQRTREGLAAKRARGDRLGRPVQLDPAVRARVAELRAEGLSIAAVAAALNGEGHRQGNGAEWTKSAVQRVLRSVALDREAERARQARELAGCS